MNIIGHWFAQEENKYNGYKFKTSHKKLVEWARRKTCHLIYYAQIPQNTIVSDESAHIQLGGLWLANISEYSNWQVKKAEIFLAMTPHVFKIFHKQICATHSCCI